VFRDPGTGGPASCAPADGAAGAGGGGAAAAGGAPPSALWATDPAGFGQVGCVYTAKGFEYDWNGVIVGPDLVWLGGRWTAVRDANKDPDLRSRAKVTDHEFERLVRNVYKVLLTRGMIGTVVYSADPELARCSCHSSRPDLSGRRSRAPGS
jgi:hypothetical protein